VYVITNDVMPVGASAYTSKFPCVDVGGNPCGDGGDASCAAFTVISAGDGEGTTAKNAVGLLANVTTYKGDEEDTAPSVT